jgi:hypothetical protein
MGTHEIRGQYDKALAELKRLRQETQLELHLAGKEVRARWHELQDRAVDLEARAKAGITEATRKSADELLVQFRKLRDGMKKVASHFPNLPG